MGETTFRECFVLVPDLEKGRQFYEQAVGLVPVTETDRSVTYDVDGTAFKIQADYPPDVLESFNLEKPDPVRRGQGAFFVLQIHEDIEIIFERVVASAGSALFEPRSVEWFDDQMFLATDPWGFTLEIRGAEQSE